MPKLIFTEIHEGLMLHYMMLTRQITGLCDCLLHIIRLHTRVKDQAEFTKLFNGYRAYTQSELADVICQTKKLCQILKISFEETIVLGDERDKEKRAEFKKRYPDDSWI